MIRRCLFESLALAIVLSCVAPASSEPVQGSLPAQWNMGAQDCAAVSQPPLQVHAYDPQTFILRQSPCADPEANFLYLLVGSQKALLIDTGAIADAGKCRWQKLFFRFYRQRMACAFGFLSCIRTDTAIITPETCNSLRRRMFRSSLQIWHRCAPSLGSTVGLRVWRTWTWATA
jgi:hypothetical protein